MSSTVTDLSLYPIFKDGLYPVPRLSEDGIFKSLNNSTNIKESKKIQEYIKTKNEVHLVDKQGQTLLFVAIQNNNLEMMKMIFMHHPYIPEGCKILLSENIDNIGKKHRQYIDQNKDILDLEIPVRYFNSEDPNNFNLAEYDAVQDINLAYWMAALGRNDILEILIDAGLKSYPIFDNNLFHHSKNGVMVAKNPVSEDTVNNLSYLMLILCAGYPVDSKVQIQGQILGKNLFCLAVESENIRAIKVLLSFGADINQTLKITSNDKEYRLSALFWACDNDNLELVQLLLEKKANINQGVEDGFPLLIAAERGNIEILNLLLNSKEIDYRIRNSDERDALHSAAANGSVECMTHLLNTGKFDINSVSKKGHTILFEAILNKNVPLVRYLLQQKADPNIQEEIQGFTPLLYSLLYNLETTRILILEGKADIDLCNFKKESPLMMAVYSGNLESVKFLLEQGADPTQKTMGGHTLINCVADSNHDSTDILEYLIEKQFIPDITREENKDDKLVIHSLQMLFAGAVEFNKINVLRFILKFIKTSVRHALTVAMNHEINECRVLLFETYIAQQFKNLSHDLNITEEMAQKILQKLSKTLADLKVAIGFLNEKEDPTVEYAGGDLYSIELKHFLPKNVKTKRSHLNILRDEIKEALKKIVKMMDEKPLSEINFQTVIWENSDNYKEIQEDMEIKKCIEHRSALINDALCIEMRFTTAIRSHFNTKKEVLALLELCDEIKNDVLILNESLKGKMIQSQTTAKNNLNKRDRSKGIQDKITSNIEQSEKISEIKVTIETLRNESIDLEQLFYSEYARNHVDMEQMCNEGNVEEAEKMLQSLKAYLTKYISLHESLKTEKNTIEEIHSNIQSQFNIVEKQLRALQREDERLRARSQALIDAKTAEEKKRLEEEQNEELRRVRQEKADAERRQCYLANREAYRLEKENKRKREALKERHRAHLEKRAVLLMTESGCQSKAISCEKYQPLLFSQRISSKTPGNLTLDRAGGGISDQLQNIETKLRAEHETDLLEHCVEAAVEMNRSISEKGKTNTRELLRILKVQRNALLGTLARCMEYLKRLKNDDMFSSSFARKFRNYLFKGNRFLLHEKLNKDEVIHLNAEIINLVNEIIFCIRTEELEGVDAIASIKSSLFTQIKQEAEIFKPGIVPSMSLCTNGIKLANKEFMFYESCQDINPLLLECAKNYSLAARGTFSMWMRDFYTSKYKESEAYKIELDGYINEGNRIRHGAVATNETNETRDRCKL